MKSWYVLTNQVGCFQADNAIMEPLLVLLKSKEKFQCNEEHSATFKASRQKIIKAVKGGITSFCPDRATSLATDWIRTGRGFHLSRSGASARR